MRGRLQEGQFYTIYLMDDEKRTFNVIMTTFEDDSIDERTCALQDRGRRVHVCVTGPHSDPRGFHPENYIDKAPVGYKYDPNVWW